MRILIVATKAPWPPVDGGRLALLNTIDALGDAGHELTLVAPALTAGAPVAEAEAALGSRCDPELLDARLPARATVALKSLLGNRPITIARHSLPAVREHVAGLLRSGSFDLVHVEQVQAMAQAGPALDSGVPVVLRQQNVESRLWSFAAGFHGAVRRRLLLREAKRLAGWEARAMAAASVTVALNRDDAEHLRRLAGTGPGIEVVPVPFAAKIPAFQRSLSGDPCVVLLASQSWRPNEIAVRAFASRWWPAVQECLPGAALHVFGVSAGGVRADGVTWHASPEDSSEAFPEGAVVAIPARHPTGVPIKGLEAWARGLPVIASPEAARSLDAVHGRELMVAADPGSFAESLACLATDPGLPARLIAGGRSALEKRHDGAVVAAGLTAVYEAVVEKEF